MLLAGLSRVHSMCPKVHFEKYHFSEVFIGFFIILRFSEKPFAHLSVKFLFFWQPFLAGFSKVNFTCPEKHFGKKRFLKCKLSLSFSDVERKQWFFGYKSFSSFLKIALLVSGGKNWGETLSLKTFNSFITLAVWAEILWYLKDIRFGHFFEGLSVLNSTCPRKIILR